MVRMGLEDVLSKAFNKAGIEGEHREELRNKVREDIEEPVKIIGAGQAGVGKSTLLRAIFDVEEEDIPDEITTDSIRPETKGFTSFQIDSEEGFKVEFTDGPGLGESIQKDEEYIPQWIDEIQDHHLLYWVIDASSRDIAHIQKNMKGILEETGFHDRIVVVLNKVDKIDLPDEAREAGAEGWNEEYNLPTDELEAQIERRTDHLVDKFENVGISRDQIVACSALKRWHTMEVLDTLIEHLPPEQQVKAAANRDVDSFTELMDEDKRKKYQ